MVSGPAPPPPPPPPSNQQNKSVLRKSQRSSANAVGAGNQQVNSQHSGTKESSGNKVQKITGYSLSITYNAFCSKLCAQVFESFDELIFICYRIR